MYSRRPCRGCGNDGASELVTAPMLLRRRGLDVAGAVGARHRALPTLPGA